jgi:glycerate kinase
VDLDRLAPVLAEVELTVASDVTNPLLGSLGAAATYGPQKGASSAQVAELDAALAHYADLLEAATGRRVRDVPGAGAAGGTTFGLLAIADRFRSLEVRPGVELVMELTGFADALATADLVLTGEGRIDRQTAFGKTALGVARRARSAGVPCVAFGGGVEPEGIAALAELGAVVVPVAEAPMTVEDAMAAGAAPIERAAERVARLVGLWA